MDRFEANLHWFASQTALERASANYSNFLGIRADRTLDDEPLLLWRGWALRSAYQAGFSHVLENGVVLPISECQDDTGKVCVLSSISKDINVQRLAGKFVRSVVLKSYERMFGIFPLWTKATLREAFLSGAMLAISNGQFGTLTEFNIYANMYQRHLLSTLNPMQNT